MSTRARIGLLIGALFILAVILVGRTFQITVLQHSNFVALAKKQQDTLRAIQPKRGTIYVQDAAAGTTIAAAESLEIFSLSVTPRDVLNKPEFAHLLASLTNTDEASILATLQKKNAQGNIVAYADPLATNLSKDQVQNIITQVNALRKQLSKSSPVVPSFDPTQGNTIYFTNGIFFTRSYKRVYPEGNFLGQTLGFVNDKDQGQYGIEGQYDTELKGYAGQVQLERDSQGSVLAQQEVVQEKDGSNYQLSIDRNIQYDAEQELAAEVQKDEAVGGSVIIMDPKTGEIRALANYPSYDPNDFRNVGKQSINLFTNPAVSSNWEPGSIFKPVVMAAAIDQGLVTPDTSNTFDESVTVNGYKIETALRRSYGTETMTKVLVNSDNVAMVWVGNKLGNQTLSDYLKMYGFGSQTGIDLTGEASGRVVPLSQWGDVQRATTTFGQGISVTPIQILTAYSAIANDGKEVMPHMVHAVQQDDSSPWQLVQPTHSQQIIKPETAAQVRDMLVQVVATNHTRAGVPGYKVGGKTGTAQVPDSVNGGYLPDAYNHSFIGMGPTDDPKFIMLVKIDQPNLAKVGMYAESTAVPLFGRIAQYLLHYYQIPPTNQ